MSEKNIEIDNLLANQIVYQQSPGAFILYKLNVNKFNLIGSARYDDTRNQLTNKTLKGDSAETSKDFSKISTRIGASYSFSDKFTAFANWAQGFVPPSTEELAANPLGYCGFNERLIPAELNSFEAGARGFFGDKIYYDIAAFVANSKNDFFRFKQRDRGNQEVFYGNAGNSERRGVEAFINFKISRDLRLGISYAFSDFKYKSSNEDSIYLDTAFVLTRPPKKGQWLPNSPKHRLYSEIVYSLGNFKFALEGEYQSKWAIYVDPRVYYGELDPSVYQNWQEGFNLFNFRISYDWNFQGIKGECAFFVRNLTNEKYMAFTEPDPDGNSYHPAPERELFGSVKITF